MLDVAILPAGSRVGLARRAWGLKRHTIAEQRGVEHHRGAEIEVDLPPGTEFNADGEVRAGGLERITVEADAYALVVPPDGAGPASVQAARRPRRRPRAGRPPRAGSAASGHDAVDVGALEHLVAQQRGGHLVELVAVLGDQPRGGALGLVGEVLLLLVAQLARAVGDLAAVRGDLARGDRRAHRVLVDHRARDLGHAVQVVGRAGRDRAEDDLLGDAPAEQHRHVVDQLLARLQVAVLLGQVERVAQRPAAGDDRDLVHAVDAGQQLGAQRVAGLVPGDDAALVLVERAARLHAGDHALERAVEVGLQDLAPARARGEDRRLVADVRQVGAGQARRSGGRAVARSTPSPSGLLRVWTLRIASRPADVGRRDEDLAVEAAGAQQRGVELLEQVRRGDDDEVAASSRSRPSRRAAG